MSFGNALFFAEASIADLITPLVNIGVAGVMLWWFMSQVWPQLKAIEAEQHKANIEIQAALDRVARSNLLLVIATGLKPLQEQSHIMLQQLDEAEKAREGGKA